MFISIDIFIVFREKYERDIKKLKKSRIYAYL